MFRKRAAAQQLLLTQHSDEQDECELTIDDGDCDETEDIGDDGDDGDDEEEEEEEEEIIAELSDCTELGDQSDPGGVPPQQQQQPLAALAPTLMSLAAPPPALPQPQPPKAPQQS